jgi:uncharacterized protein YbaR (Trm112 family)
MSDPTPGPITARQVKELYERDVNILRFFREDLGTERNTVGAIQLAYDLQSGSYIDRLRWDSEHGQRLEGYTEKMLAYLEPCAAESILEAGVGEATVLCPLIRKLAKRPVRVSAFDLSWSRVMYARRYAEQVGGIQPRFFTGDLFQIPAIDGAYDLVYTSHAIEPNHPREREALRELYRVTRRWLVLFEPSYELGGEETRRNIETHGYCRDLPEIARELGYEVVQHDLLDFVHTPRNRTGVLVIRKPDSHGASLEEELACPQCRQGLAAIRGQLYCRECCLIYPVIEGIPCLLAANGILGSKFPEL